MSVNEVPIPLPIDTQFALATLGAFATLNVCDESITLVVRDHFWRSKKGRYAVPLSFVLIIP